MSRRARPEPPTDAPRGSGLAELAARFQALNRLMVGRLVEGLGRAHPLWRGEALRQAGESLAPEELRALADDYRQQQWALWLATLKRQAGAEVEPVAEPDPGDRRFAGEDWVRYPFFDYIKQHYLINERCVHDLVEAAPVPEAVREQAAFLARQVLNALAPSNFALTNPEVLRLAIESGGETLSRGLSHLAGDLEKGWITTADTGTFRVGRDLATTPGAVVHRNELFELIEYQATTPKIYARPLLVVPPCINKYYALDLTPENSLVAWCVAQGFRVFMISWRNPDAELGRLAWEDYLEQGVLEAMGVARAIAGTTRLHTAGWCIGGTLLATALAVEAKRGRRPAASLTLLTTLLDFADPGEIRVFLDRDGLAARAPDLEAGSLVRARDIAATFLSLRANDLLWNQVVRNYLKGEPAGAQDLLYWNADGTNLPGPFFRWYSENCYHDNRLASPGSAQLCGVPVDLASIGVPSYVVGARDDHIVPWEGAYASARLLGGDPVFVLAGGGHIGGVVSPPRRRRGYFIAPYGPDAEDWQCDAESREGSWWEHWTHWLAGHSGRRRAAPEAPGSLDHPALDAAPGRYVLVRAD